MSEMADEDLLGADELDDGSDISDEREEALLQDEEDYPKGRDMYDSRKKESYSDTEEPDDVLNLDIEEDFQDEGKDLYDEEPCEKDDEKFSVENSKQNVTTFVKVPVKSKQVAPKSVPAVQKQKSNIAPQKVNTNKKPFVRNDKWKRGNEKGNFQQRPRFPKNNMQRRRNGTVLINPRYEGTVHIADNNARLAWDNSNVQYPQRNTNTISPWAPGSVLGNCDTSSLLVTNLMTGIASLTQQPANRLLPQTRSSVQNFYQVSSNNYKPQLSFEPPPNITEPPPLQQPFRNQHPVTNQQMLPPVHQSYYKEPQHHFNNQVSTNRMQENSYSNYDSYSRAMTQQNYSAEPQKNLNLTNSYEDKNLNYNRPNNKFTTYNNFPSQNNYQNKNVGYGNSSYQSKSSNYSDNITKQVNYSNYGSLTYEKKNLNRNDFNQRNENINYRTDFRQNQNLNTFNNKFQNKPQQGQFRNDLNGSNNTVPQRNNIFDRPGNRRPITKEIDTHDESKKAKINEQVKPAPTKTNDDLQKNNVEQKIQQTDNKAPEEEEDEETRLYRLKIEEQKRERERILRIKEERRKQMLLQRQKQDEEKLATATPGGQFQHSTQHQQPPKPAQFTKKFNVEQSAGTGIVQRTNQYQPAHIQRQSQAQSLSGSSLGDSQQQNQFSNNSLDSSTELSNFTFKVSNDLRSNAPVAKNPPKTEASSSSFMSDRVVIVKSKTNQKSGTLTNSTVTKPVSNETSNESSDVGQGLSSFFNNRKVLKKDNNLLNTKLVVVNNLSATINQNKLMALSRGIGEIQTLRVDKQERQATILFKSVASAHAFFKKYQRRILDDLSVIEVKLEPML